jgi:hypothetical protein
VFSLELRCQGLCGSQKYTAMSVAMVMRLWSVNSLPRSHVSDLYKFRYLGNALGPPGQQPKPINFPFTRDRYCNPVGCSILAFLGEK